MKKLVTVVMVIATGMFLASCAKKATMEECTKACERKAALEAAANPPAPTPDPVAKVEADFAKKTQELQAQVDQAVATIDQEFQTKIAAAKKEDEKTKLTEEANAAKEAKKAEFAPQFATLNQQKTEALKAAADAKAKAEADRKAAEEKALAACADSCMQGGVTQAKATCQVNAASLDEFARCE